MLHKWIAKLTWMKTYPIEIIIIGFLFVLALMVRLSLMDWISGDYTSFLRPWMQQIVNGGGFASLGSKIGDYTPPYMYLLTILSYFPDQSSSEPFLNGIKFISIGFDVLLMVGVYLNASLWLKAYHRLLPVLVAISSLFLPTVLINGSLWGQIDASYTAFGLIALYYLQKDQPFISAVWFGVAFSFKLQAIFFLPVFMLYFWYQYRQKIVYVFIVPIVYYVLALPALIAGRSFTDITTIYLLQTQTYPLLTLNMPNMYQWFPNQRYEDLSLFAIGLFTALMAIQWLAMLMQKITLKKEHILLFTYWSILMANFFLPAMHERYLFAADVIVILLVLQYGKKYFMVLLTQLISLLAYAPFIFNQTPIPHDEVAVGFLVTLILATYWLWSSLKQPFLKKEI
jgi:Gpi18-like mannosyltransferase